VVDSSSNRPISIFFVCNTTPICEGPFLPVKGLEFLQAILLYMMGEDLALCIGGVADVCIDNCVS